MGYIFILLVFPIETLQIHYMRFFIVAIYQSGNGYKSYKSNKISIKRRKKNNRYIVDEILIKIGSQYTWLWVAIIEPKHKQILQQIDISFERTMLIVAE